MNSEVIFKERDEGREIKTEGTTDDATLWFYFQASTLENPSTAQGAGERHEDPRTAELRKFSLWFKKYDRKGDFEGWVNEFQEYAVLGQWRDDEQASLLFLSLTRKAWMYFMGLT